MSSLIDQLNKEDNEWFKKIDDEDNEWLAKLEWFIYFTKVVEFDVWRNENLKNDIIKFQTKVLTMSVHYKLKSSIEKRLYEMNSKDDYFKYFSIYNEFEKLGVITFKLYYITHKMGIINTIYKAMNDSLVQMLECVLIEKFRKKYIT